MKSNREMRDEAWGALFVRRWIGRLIAVSLLFFAVNTMVQLTFSSVCEVAGIMTVEDYRTENKLSKITGEAPPVKPTKAQLPGIFAASAFEYFILFIFAGIAAYGNSRVQLKAARGEESPDWFRGTLDGFKDPFGMLGLMFRQGLQIFLWTLLLVVPGIVAAYRYRNAWFVKADHPDWSAGACLRESGRLMRGRKGRAFLFDLSYWKWMLVMFAGFFILACGASVIASPEASSVLKTLTILVALGGFSLMLVTCVVCGFYMTVGRAVFYRELLADDSLSNAGVENAVGQEEQERI